MNYIKTFEEFINESVNNNDTVISVTTRSNKKYDYKRNEIQDLINDLDLSADNLPKWLYAYFIELDKRSRNPHKTSKNAEQQVKSKLNSLLKHTGKPEQLNLNI